MFCEKYYKKLLNYAKKDQIWADPNCPYRGSLCSPDQADASSQCVSQDHHESENFSTITNLQLLL